MTYAIEHLNNADNFLDKITKILAEKCSKDGKISVALMDKYQVLNYNLAWMRAEIMAAKDMTGYPKRVSVSEDSLEHNLAVFFAADAMRDFISRMPQHLNELEITWKEFAESVNIEELNSFASQYSSEEYASVITDKIRETGSFGIYGLNDDQQMMMDAFRSFAEDQVIPLAENIHRQDLTIPDAIINGLAQMGCFGLSIPDTYGGFQNEEAEDHTSMAVVTEELSRGSLGAAGSLITRPEIISKAILAGGTAAQKQHWLPALASGEKLGGVAVTEPDFGSDVAGIKVSAVKTADGWKINGTKTWCTFAGKAHVLLVLCRTNPDMSLKHKGLSILLAEKPPTDKHEFSHTQTGGGKISGKAISTIGYRGMHSYEVSFEDYIVPSENLIGGDDGLGKGFYLQMAGFAGGRLQTAARAAGVMQAALEKALQYSIDRKVFGQPIFNYGMTKYKIAKMAAITQTVRQLTYKCARLMDEKLGQMEASLVKMYASRIAEWVTREAMQIHGGMGYAEEYEVSRLYLDSRVFSIFEGAEEVLALRVIAKSLLESAL